MSILRTPDECFKNLAGFPFEPRYQEIQDEDLGSLRIHYVDEGPRDGAVILCLHGEPSWSYLYRKMIPLFTAAGFRAVAPDLVGFGRSDKPSQRRAYSHKTHVRGRKDGVDGGGAIDRQRGEVGKEDAGLRDLGLHRVRRVQGRLGHGSETDAAKGAEHGGLREST